MYKYSCRKCPIRSRCIDESDNSPSAKVMVRRAFEARTDTLATWALLQKNCLLIKAEQERSTSALSDRLRDAREAKADMDTGELQLKEETEEAPKKSVIRRIRPQRSKQQGAQTNAKKSDQQAPDYLKPVSSSREKRPIRPLKRLSSANKQAAPGGSKYYWFTVASTRRHIALPDTGQLSFGHFDPNVGIPPDIDFTYEDKGYHYISRRHATVVGQNGRHTIEDLGSRAGVFLNGTQVNSGPSVPLEPGDRISLGKVQLIYEQIPAKILQAAKSDRVRHTLLVTPTGRKMVLSRDKNIIIGRSDPQVNFTPDVDLSRDGEVSRLVSRRHATIRWQNGQPYLEDLGSGFGTRLGGELLTLGQAVPLKPGDHIWLAGCVLAYDVEL